MSEQIIIRLGSQPEQRISWLVWASHSAEIIASGELQQADELMALAERLGSRPVIALIPASEVVLKQVVLPGKPNRQLLQALPYILEEEQAEDVEQLWFALGQLQQQDGQYLQQVAICRRQQLESWLNCLQQAGFSVSRMLPDALLLPEQALPVCIQLHQQWLLKQSNWQATAVDENWWPDFLNLAALPEIISYSPWPEQVHQLHQPAEPELPLALLARGLEQSSFNLLQGEYAPKSAANQLWQRWRLSAALVAACFLLYFVNQGLTVWQLKQQTAGLRQQTVSLYQQLFPGERIVNLPLQLRQKLATVGANQDDKHFPALLLVLQQQLVKTPDITLDSLRYDYRRAELRLQARGENFQSFERLKTALEQQGFIVEQGALSNDGARVQGSVSLRRPV